jgi:hypothetical protein
MAVLFMEHIRRAHADKLRAATKALIAAKSREALEIVRNGGKANPYLDVVSELRARLGNLEWDVILEACRSAFAYAIPDADVLAAVAKDSPLIEIGGGSGYWAWCLAQYGADVVSFDARIPTRPKSHWSQHWTEVHPGNERKIPLHPGRTLLLCWPEYHQPQASECLKRYHGNALWYVGESNGCTGDDAFHNELWKNWELVKEIYIPNWDGLHDYAMRWVRKEAKPCSPGS